MIQIDGSYREGGGQIVRTATALSTYVEEPVKIDKIRANRSNPGLRPQHVKGIETLARLCDADLEGVKEGSQEIEFIPSEFKPRDLKVDIGTAGSVTLLLQSLMFPLLHSEEEVKVVVMGGTDVKWSPPVDYLRKVLLPILNNHGYNVHLELEKRGYYPKGGGKVTLRVKSSELESFDLTEKESVKDIKGISHASEHLKDADVADRQKKAARKAVWEEFEISPDIETRYMDSACPGSGIQLWVETESSRIGGNALGEKGKRSEEVGKEAAEDLIRNSEGAVDRYAGDQLLPFLATAGGNIKVSEVTEHCHTNQWVIQRFLDVDFSVQGKLIQIS